MTAFLEKDREASLEYGWDWADYLLAGDSIDQSVWSVSGSDELLTTTAPDVAGTITAITIAGGTAGAKYTVTNKVTTANGFIDRRSMVFRIVNR